MKAVILYDSGYGNTKSIAEAVASGLGAGARAVPVDRFEPGSIQAGDLLRAAKWADDLADAVK